MTRRTPLAAGLGPGVFRLGILGLAAPLLAACAGPDAAIPPAPLNAEAERGRLQREALDQALATQRRLTDLLWPLMVANAELCRDTVAPSVGVTIADREVLSAFVPELRPRQVKALSPGEDAFILTVAAGSPAAAAGLAPGDRIRAINDEPLKTPVRRSALERALDTALEAEEDAHTAPLAPVTLDVARDGEDARTVDLTPVWACDVTLMLENTAELGATGGGGDITFTAGLVDALEDDDAIAFVLSHEMVHATQGHMGKVVRNFLITGGPVVLPVVGVAGGVVDLAASFSPVQPTIPPGQNATIRIAAAMLNAEALEREADYIGAYFAARAGYDVRKGRDAFEEISLSVPGRTWYDPAHLPTAERMLILDAVAAEIDDKRALGEALIPAMR